MLKVLGKKIPLPGYRNIKTGLAVLICILLYSFIDRDQVILAASAALICMQGSVEDSIYTGLNRILGTIVGGSLGIILLNIENIGVNYYLWNVIVSLGVVLIIYAFNLLKKNSSTVIACFVYLVIVLDPALAKPIDYSLNRIFDTIVGVVIAIIVNYFFFRPSHDRLGIKSELDGEQFEYMIVREETFKTNKWSGGISNEIFIYPTKSTFIERNFKWRISISTVDFRETVFSLLKGFLRTVMVLNGTVKLKHDDNEITLKKFEQFTFDGGKETKCVGLSEDFNLITAEDYEGFLETQRSCDKILIQNMPNHIFETKAIFSLYDDLIVTMSLPDEEVEINLSKKDLFILNNINKLNENISLEIKSSNSEVCDIVAIVISVGQIKDFE